MGTSTHSKTWDMGWARVNYDRMILAVGVLNKHYKY